MVFALLVSAALACVPAPAAVVQPDRASPSVAAQKDAMKKVSWLAGDWEGTAKIDSGRGGGEEAWMSVRQSETIREKLGGRVLLIEGTGRSKDPSGTEQVVFEALATLAYDPESKTYKMRAFGPEGAVDPKVEVGEQSLVWSFPTRMGQIRYTIRLDAQSRWSEIGERSSDDGKTWTKFIDMVLEKKK